MFTKSSVLAFASIVLFGFSTAACGAAPSSDDTSTNDVDDADAQLVSTSAHFETFVGQDGKTYFDLVAGNGQNVLRSQAYTRDDSAMKGIASVLANGTSTTHYKLLQAVDGSYYFNLVAGNNEVIGTSEMYTTKTSASRGASTVRGLLRLLTQPPATSAAPRLARFETFTGEDRQVHFRLRAGNGEIVLSSEGYVDAAGAMNGIASVEENGVDTTSFDVFETASGQYAFRLVAANGETIAHGESYASKSNADRAVSTIASLLSRGVTVTAL